MAAEITCITCKARIREARVDSWGTIFACGFIGAMLSICIMAIMFIERV
jgi:hypothetical protein